MAKINKYWGLVAVGALTAAAAGAIAALVSRRSVCEEDFEDDFEATSGNDRSAEETTKFADYGKAGAFYEDCSSGNRVCGIVHGSSAGPES